jgi:hypothetical protein
MKTQFNIGDTVEMPEPNESDAWTYGGFYAVVADIRENGNLIVEDADSDFWEIEAERAIKVQDEITIPSIVVTRKMTYNPAPYLDYCEENQLTPTKDGFEEFIETWISADFQNENYEEEFSYVVS